jgi:hypothetical protein
MKLERPQFSKKKKFFLFIFLLLLVSIGFLLYVRAQAKSSQVKVDELSERAKEFIEEEKKKSGSAWKTAEFVENTEGQADSQPKNFPTRCMTVQMPITTRNEHINETEEMCKIQVRTNSPPARLIITAQPNTSDLNEDSGIIMRKKFPEEYKKRDISYPSWEEVQRYDQKDGTVVFLKTENWLVTVGITEMIQPEKLTDELVQQIVSGISLKESL